MSLYYEDGTNVRSNQVTAIGCGGPAYNAVLSAVFSGENATEQITLDETKDWCRIDVTDDDLLLSKLIKGARLVCERYVNMSFITRTVTAKFHNGLGDIELPYGPVSGTANYFQLDGTTAISGFDKTLPSGDNIIAVYSAGYANGALPEDLRTAWLDQIAWMYQNRGDAAVASSLSLASQLTLQPLRNV